VLQALVTVELSVELAEVPPLYLIQRVGAIAAPRKSGLLQLHLLEQVHPFYFATAGAAGPRNVARDLESGPPPLPNSIGRYRILRLLGEGGMGAVYEAEQEQPRRLVALKIIKSGIWSADALRRFERESQILGRLQNPGIARIYEAGTANSGSSVQPYFAMEFIDGRALLNYADHNRLTLRQRLELMIQVCNAVQHAHQRGIIHRDLKPCNILVDETGQPKVLDFGVARVMDDFHIRARMPNGTTTLESVTAGRSVAIALSSPNAQEAPSRITAAPIRMHFSAVETPQSDPGPEP